MKKLKVSPDDHESRMLFVKYWADYVRTHPDRVWGEQQKVVIDSQMPQSAGQCSRKDYLKLRGEKFSS